MRGRELAGLGALAGIGFTVSLFIAELAFDDERLVNEAKVGIIAGSLVARRARCAFCWRGAWTR